MRLPSASKSTTYAKLVALITVGAVVGYFANPWRDQRLPSEQSSPAPAALLQPRSGHVRATPPQDPTAAPTRSGSAATAATPEQANPAAIAREYLLEGRDLIAVGEWAAAVEAFQMAVEIDSTAETNGALGALHFRLASPTGAYTYLNRALEMDPYNADRWIALANALQLRGNPGEAWQALARARQLEPGLVLERDPSGFAYRGDNGPETVFQASRFIPSDITRRTPR